jgi:HEAT repeat protein
MLTALVAAPVTAAYARAGRKRKLIRLILLTSMVLMVSLVLMRLLIELRSPWVFYLFYSWVGVAGGLTTSQFWLLANGVFDSAQAKRIFPVLGLGGIAGAFVGGEVTGFLVRYAGVPTQNLLLVAVVVLGLAGVTSVAAWRRRTVFIDGRSSVREKDEGSSFKDIISSIGRSQHLKLTVGIIALTVMTASFVDFQFKTVSWQNHPTQGDLTTFLGRFYGRMSLLSFLVQALLAARLIRWVGVGGVLMVLPGLLALGAGGMALLPGMMAAMVLRGSDITFKYSIDKTSRELLFLPIPLALKKRTKVFIDMFVDRWARGMAGGFLLLLTAVMGFGVRGVAVVTLVLILVWLVMAFLMRREYVNSFRKAVTRREIDLSALTVKIDDRSAFNVLTASLGSANTREVVYALDMLRDAASPSLAPALRPLVDHPESGVRRRTLDLLRVSGDRDDGNLARPMLADPDLEVRVAAVACLAALDGDSGGEDRFLGKLMAGSAEGRNAALEYVSREGGEHMAVITPLVVERIMADESPAGVEGRAILAGLPGLPDGIGEDVWDRLLVDTEPVVVKAAVSGFGRRVDRERTSWLLARLCDPPLRATARDALSCLGPGAPMVLEDLESFFLDTEAPPRARAEIPRALAGVPSQKAVDILLKHLVTEEPFLRYEVLKALGKLRAGDLGLAFDPKIVSHQIAVEVGRYFQLAGVMNLLPVGTREADLLGRAIGEIQQLRLESVFRLLGLLYPARDLLNAYHGIMSGRRVLRANAQEFLDNLLTGRHRRLVLSLIDEQPATEAWLESAVSLGFDPGNEIRTRDEALDFLATGCDPWLGACAALAGASNVGGPAAHLLEKAGDEMLSPIEKVLVLQNVDVFSEVPTDQLAALAGIARETNVMAEEDVYREDDLPDALYLVLEGSVKLHQGDRLITMAGPLTPFGTWALFDDEPRVMTASAAEDSRLLRIDREEFIDLLSDEVRIAQGIIKTVARRLRELAERAT